MVLIDKFSSVCVSVVGKFFVLFINSKRYHMVWFGLSERQKCPRGHSNMIRGWELALRVISSASDASCVDFVRHTCNLLYAI